MATLISLLKNEPIDALNLPDDLNEKIVGHNIATLLQLFSFVQMQKVGRGEKTGNWTAIEIDLLDKSIKNFLEENKTEGTPGSNSTRHNKGDANSVTKQIKVPANRYLNILGKELVDLELIYRPKLRHVELVGEIPLTRDELSALSDLFRRVFSKHSSKDALEAVEKGSPASFILFLVGHGVYGYNGGDYWTSIDNALGQRVDYRFGQVFERIVRQNRLAVFEELQKKSTRYVSLILAHGGIPIYCLDDFFSNLVLASISRPQYLGLDGDELLHALLSSSIVDNTDKPVTHFLEYGGRVAQDIFSRSRRLMTQWQTNHIVQMAEEVGLPNHMVQHFGEWIKTKGIITSSGKNHRSRLKKPEFCIDPWGLGIFLRLPAQAVPVLQSEDCEWRIESRGHLQKIPVEIDAQGFTRETTIRLESVAESYNIIFCQSDKQYEWVFDTSDVIFIFDPEHGNLISRLNNKEIWLLYPRSLHVEIISGEGYQTEELPSMPGNWYGLNAEGWDFSNAEKVAFTGANGFIKEYEIKVEEKLSPPCLIGGKVLDNKLGVNENDPIYIGKPPRIQISLPINMEPVEILNRWRVSIRPIGLADPQDQRQVQLSELPKTAINLCEKSIEILLESELLLTQQPMGTFEINMLGPLGQDTNFRIACVPVCNLSGIEQLYIPSRFGAENVDIEVTLGLIDHLQAADGSGNIQIQKTRSGTFVVKVPPAISHVSLEIIREIQTGTIIVPLSFRVQRLRWRLVTEELLETWSDSLLEMSMVTFVKSSSPLLIVSLPNSEANNIDLCLRLLDINSNELLQLQPAKRSEKYSGDFWRFDLNVLQSNLHETTAPLLRLELIANGISVNGQITLPIVSFTRSIDIQNIAIEIEDVSDEYVIQLHWRESYPLQSRSLYLWSLWRPWQSVVAVPVPDDAKGHFRFSLNKESLTGGDYRLGFAIVDPWITIEPPRVPPELGTAGTVDFQLASETRVMCLKESANSYEQHLELALVSRLQDDSIFVEQETKWCLKNVHLASGKQVLILRDHLLELSQDSFIKEFGDRIILPQVLEMLLGEIEQGRITPSDVSVLLRFAPNSSSWDEITCQLLCNFDDRRWRIEGLKGLVGRAPVEATTLALSLVKKGAIGIEDAVEILAENRPLVIESLNSQKSSDATAQKLLEFLHLFNSYSGLPMVRVGTWVRTNAGWGKIESILDAATHVSVDEFMENQGLYRLAIRLHIEIDPEFIGERAIIDMKEKTVTFQRAKLVYICEHCQEFMTTRRDMYKSHLVLVHPGKYPCPPTSKTSFIYSELEFNHCRK